MFCVFLFFYLLFDNFLLNFSIIFVYFLNILSGVFYLFEFFAFFAIILFVLLFKSILYNTFFAIVVTDSSKNKASTLKLLPFRFSKLLNSLIWMGR